MDAFHKILKRNKTSKGEFIVEAMDAISRMDTAALGSKGDEGTRSPLGLVIELAPNERQAMTMAQALVARGAPAGDEQVEGQKHNKAINQAIRKSYYHVVDMLILHGADVESIVHEWIRRPKSKGEACAQLALEQAIWNGYSHKARIDQHVAIMASLMACEVLSGQETDPEIRCEVMQMAREQAELMDWDNRQYVFSNLNDAASALRNPAKSTERMLACMGRWFHGIRGERWHHEKPLDQFTSIPQDFWTLLPGVQSDLQARELDEDTKLSSGQGRKLRL